ncbi:hypothetical protein F2Q68_00037097 [Brassica cretica]|uniref:RNase H type-1 domain-containing protein n=1 Tax=Brassica cretica TaxID=69181 RepID=A0A8S9HCD6_BRACR|nr:hypothetical protein F2Q68_00037097 [Brassica cretica]
MLSRETKEWNKALVEKILPELAYHIFSIRPSTMDAPDSYIWTHQDSRIYSAKSGYYAAQLAKIQSTNQLLNYADGVIGNTSCTTYGEEETLEHILFRCNKAREVWKLCLWPVSFNSASCSSFREAIQSSFTKVNLPPTGSSSNMCPWICWGLWTGRNQLLFDNRQASPAEILTKAISLLKEWEAAQGLVPSLPTSTAIQNPIQITSTAVILCNMYAAWNKDSKSAGLAWIFTDQTGQELNRGCLYQDHVSSPLMAESLAVRAAIEHAASLNFDYIWLRSECKGLIQSINAKQRSMKLFGVLADIESLIRSSFSSF